ncbi:C-terminal processing peptidase [Thiovulum sp. ES]|nr:C-terminal processing peptidase [Thiovulum sp. ES]
MKQKRFFFLGSALSFLFIYSVSTTSLGAVERESDDGNSRIEAMRKLANVITIVEENSVDELKFQEIVEKTISGLMSELDAHSSYLTEENYKNFKIQTAGEFGGLGITVGLRDKALTIIAPIDDTPAYRAGLKAGDIILKIEDKSTLDMSLDEAVSLMRGKVGSPIEITIVRKGKAKPFKVRIVRDIIKIESVFVKKIDEDILYVRVSNFDRKVVEGVQKALKEKLPSQKGLILDLRSNPGGLLDQAVGLVDLFVSEGVIVSQKGRDESETKIYNATKRGTFKDIPMVVLIDVGSASASEIVSGALQDHKRAVVIGEKSFGKGSVQAIWPITRDGSEAIKLTIARYYLPSGRTIQAEGVVPDIEVFLGDVPQKDDDAFEVREANLKKHLESELEKVDGFKNSDEVKSEDENSSIITKEKIYKDSQLKSAIDIVRSLYLLGR